LKPNETKTDTNPTAATILVVDDNQINRLIAREMMMSCGAVLFTR